MNSARQHSKSYTMLGTTREEVHGCMPLYIHISTDPSSGRACRRCTKESATIPPGHHTSIGLLLRFGILLSIHMGLSVLAVDAAWTSLPFVPINAPRALTTVQFRLATLIVACKCVIGCKYRRAITRYYTSQSIFLKGRRQCSAQQ